MRILVLEGKHTTDYWDVSTKEKIRAAYEMLFKLFDEQGAFLMYSEAEVEKARVRLEEVEENFKKFAEISSDLEDIQDMKDKSHKRLKRLTRDYKIQKELREDYLRAKEGSVPACETMCREVRGYEYTNWDIVTPTNPIED